MIQGLLKPNNIRSRMSSPLPAPFNQEVDSRIEAFEPLALALAQWARTAGISERTLGSVTLILDELFANSVMHGYRNAPRGRIAVRAWLDGDTVWVSLRDWAPAFNPMLAPDPDTGAPLESRPIGGLGLLFVRRTADSLRYQRIDPQSPTAANEITFGKRYAD